MSATVQLCVLQLGDEEYVIDLMRVDEIIRVPRVAPLTKPLEGVDGVVAFRGARLPVIDVRRRFRKQPPSVPSGKDDRLLVCRVGSRHVGLIVDRVSAVLRVSRQALRPRSFPDEALRSFVLGVCESGDQSRWMLDVRALVENAA